MKLERRIKYTNCKGNSFYTKEEAISDSITETVEIWLDGRVFHNEEELNAYLALKNLKKWTNDFFKVATSPEYVLAVIIENKEDLVEWLSDLSVEGPEDFFNDVDRPESEWNFNTY